MLYGEEPTMTGIMAFDVNIHDNFFSQFTHRPRKVHKKIKFQ